MSRVGGLPVSRVGGLPVSRVGGLPVGRVGGLPVSRGRPFHIVGAARVLGLPLAGPGAYRGLVPAMSGEASRAARRALLGRGEGFEERASPRLDTQGASPSDERPSGYAGSGRRVARLVEPC